MKKIILLYSFLSGTCFSTYAQSSCQVSINDTIFNDSIVTSAPISTSILDQSIFSFYFKNITSNTIQLKWKVVQRSIPASWDYSMCDYATCRDIFTDSTEYTMYEAAPDFKSYLLFHILPKDQSTATLRIYVYDKNHPLQGDMVTWIIHGANAAGVHDINASLRFSMFPNPASEHITIEGENVSIKGAEVSLYNILGEELAHIKSKSDQLNIDISPYDNGIYFLKIRKGEGVATTKISVRK